ncbi:hypothetical protein P7C71_g720, partial [Lecanoromycetidae sp. Uapishka_2]
MPGQEHGLGISGLRRIRQQPPSRAPSQPSSPTTPYALPPRSSSMTLGMSSSQGFTRSGPASPSLNFSEDLSRFPSESLHSFSFAHQSEDALHNRTSVLKRAIDFMRDRLGFGVNHPGVMAAQAKVSGNTEIQGMVDLLVRANILGNDSRDRHTSRQLHGPLTGPADVEGNVFEKAFVPRPQSPGQLKKAPSERTLPESGDADLSGTTSNQPEISLNTDTSSIEPPGSDSPLSSSSVTQARQLFSDRSGMRRTYTDLSLLTLQTKLVEALARPYKASDHIHDNLLLSPTPNASVHTGINTPSHVHGHNNRWVPAAQAVFTTEASSPWIIKAANDLACLVFGVTKAEVKKMSMLEVMPKRKGSSIRAKIGFKEDNTVQYFATIREDDIRIPVSTTMEPDGRSLRVSSFPHIAGIVVLSASTLRVINSNSVFSAALFGQADLDGQKINQLIPQFEKTLDILTEEDNVHLVDGIVVPEHSFRRARALLSLQEGGVDAAAMFLNPQGLVARHRDGSEINVDVQMRVVRSEAKATDDSVIEEKSEDDDASSQNSSSPELSEVVYALWITYSRQLHSAIQPDGASTPDLSRPADPRPAEPNPLSPGQADRFASPQPIDQEDMKSDTLPPSTLTQQIQEAASQPISEAQTDRAKSESLSTIAKKKERRKKKITDFIILEEMGQGAYGQVKLARYSPTNGQKVVLKYVTKNRILADTWIRDRRLGMVPLEIHVLEYLRKDELRHPNIVEMVDFFEDDVNYYIEMVPHGLPGMDLFDYIEMRSTMDEAECRSIFLQVVSAVQHLHTEALVVHRDIKDENIILDGEGNVKLIDFGSAAYIKNGPFDVFVGTIDYAAPEVLQGKSYRGKEQDIWALGILLYTLVYKENPFYSIDEILDHELRIPWIMSQPSIDLIKAMLNRDVDQRLTITQVKEHRWCVEAVDPSSEGGEGQ